MPVDAEILRNILLFDGLPAEYRALVSERGRLRSYKAHTVMINQHDPGDTLYLIVSGVVKLSLNRPDGREVFLAVLARGDHFGELSLVDSMCRSATVVTQGETSLLLIDRDLFHELTYCREFSLNLLRSLSARFRRSNERIGNLACMSVYGLIAYHINEFAELYGQPISSGNGVIIPIRLTQCDLADLIGASRSRVNQAISDFKAKGAITVDGQSHITVLNFGYLRRCIEME